MLARLDNAARTAIMASIGLWTFGFLMVFGVLYMPGGRGVPPTLLSQVPVFLVAVICSLGLFGVFRSQETRPLARWLWVITACVAAALATALVDVWLTDFAARTFVPEWLSWGTFSLKRLRSLFIFYVWPFAANVALIWAMSANERARRLERRAAEAEAARQHAHLSALRLQLNPHFLFNTLNTISALVAERESEEARAMIGRLADFLRASLATDAASLITLGDELDIVQAYLEIEGVRFEDRLLLDIDCVPALRGAMVPGFLLQPLVENAVKYAISPAMRPVTLAVRARREGDELVLEVADDGEGAGPAAPVSAGGYGLTNVRARLTAMYGAQGKLDTSVTNPGFRARIRLPLMRGHEQLRQAAGTIH